MANPDNSDFDDFVCEVMDAKYISFILNIPSNFFHKPVSSKSKILITKQYNSCFPPFLVPKKSVLKWFIILHFFSFFMIKFVYDYFL